MKKLTRLFFITLMATCILSCATVAFATGDVVIEKVEISFSEPTVGEVAKLPELSLDANYIVNTDNSWWYMHEKGGAMAEDEKFTLGAAYELILNMVPKDGYCFTEETVLIVNGTPITPSQVSGSNISYSSSTYYLRYPLERVDVFFDPPASGGTFNLPTVPEDAEYWIDMENTYCKDELTGEKLSVGDDFERDKTYRLYVCLKPNLENSFSKEVKLYINDTLVVADSVDDGCITSSDFAFGKSDDSVDADLSDKNSASGTETQSEKTPPITDDNMNLLLFGFVLISSLTGIIVFHRKEEL